MSTLTFEPGGDRFIKSIFPYSAGVAAMPGYRIVELEYEMDCRDIAVERIES